MNTINRKISIIVPEDGLKRKLDLKRPLNVKLGFDPTAPDLHLGHAVVLNKLKDFQDEGHKIIVIIGDYTARIGDPTGRNITRPPLTEKEVKENAQTYINQLSKVIDINKVDIRYNSEWFSKMEMSDIIQLMSQVTLAQMMQRNDFRERYEKDLSISLHELLYPVMQGYDSIMIDADIEIGGTDQLFNCMVGKSLQDTQGKDSQAVICMPLLRGTDGHEKMSKSKNNYIGLTEDPENMFGKIMSIPDDLIQEYLELATTFTDEEKNVIKQTLAQDNTNPMDIKKDIATNIVAQYHGQSGSEKGRNAFENKVQNKAFTEDDYKDVVISMTHINANNSLLEICSFAYPEKSKSELKRLAKGGAIKVNQEKVSDLLSPLSQSNTSSPFKLQIGKRALFNIKIEKE